MPNNAPQVKVDAIINYGAKVEFCEPTTEARIKACEKAVAESGAFLVHPHNDYNVMAGQVSITVTNALQYTLLTALSIL